MGVSLAEEAANVCSNPGENDDSTNCGSEDEGDRVQRFLRRDNYQFLRIKCRGFV